MAMYRAGMVEGLFLSSGIIKGGITTQDRLIDTAELLRIKHGYRGYIHLKIMPGAEKDQVRRSMQMASRVSVNLEGPNTKRLGLLAPKKIFLEELLRPLKWVEEIRRSEVPHGVWNGGRPGQRLAEGLANDRAEGLANDRAEGLANDRAVGLLRRHNSSLEQWERPI
jgi:hypothetical protein